MVVTFYELIKNQLSRMKIPKKKEAKHLKSQLKNLY